MLHVFGFKRLGVAVSELYFKSANPIAGQEGHERGVRLELRLLTEGEHDGSIYDSYPIVVDRPIWRVDLLESVENPGTLDRAHHHPDVVGWNTGKRHFDDEFSADPVGWVVNLLANVQEFFGTDARNDVQIDAEDFDELRAATPEIERVIRRLLDSIAAGELAGVPAGAQDAPYIRTGWL